MPFYEGRKVLVTGGTGMIGSHLAEMLVDQGAKVRVTEFNTPAEKVFSSDYLKKLEVVKADLRNFKECEDSVKGMEYVFHLATRLTGVIGNLERPVEMFTPNVIMQTNMIEAAHRENIERYLYQSSACIYSSDCEAPYREEDGMTGLPDKNNEAYAWMKRMGEQTAIFYHREYGMKIGISRPFNTFGPRDNFGKDSAHVIASLIMRAESRENPFSIWGSPDTTREFVYVTDTARGIMRILEKHAKADPINIATGREFTIKELSDTILRASGFLDARVVFDKSKPHGQTRRCGSTEKMRRILDFEPEVGLEEGIDRTVKWYRSNSDRLKEYD